MLSNLNHVGFNITKNKLQLVEVVKESSKYCLENVNEHIFDEEFGFNIEESKIISILQTSLNSISNKISLKSKNISFSLPLSEFQIFEIPFEKSLSNTELIEHVRWEFSILYPMFNASDYIIRTLHLVSIENENRILVIGLLNKTVNTLLKFSLQNNFIIKFIDSAHFSSDSNILLKDRKKTLSIYVDNSFCSINSYLGIELHSTKKIELVNNSNLVNSIYEFWEFQNMAYDNIFMASSIETEMHKNELEQKINNPIKVINPFQSIDVSKSFIQNAHFLNNANLFSSAAGICYRKF